LRVFSTLISTDALAGLLEREAAVVVDVRHDLADPAAGERAYAEGHLPGAHFLHLDRDLSGPKTGRNGRHPLPEAGTLAAALGAIGADADTQVVVYDQAAGMFAARAWWLLRWLGHDAVAVLDGGFAKWVREGRATSVERPVPGPRCFAGGPPAATASAAEILANLGRAGLTVVDARAPERYRGDVEPLDPVAGHIPGAINRPYTENLLSDGTLKPAAQLRREYLALLADRDVATVVHQCGSGVTACHNVLAMQIAGLAGSRLYPGSWSEWCSDPSRPVARGPSP
jgi:thiosulfate/3-mercaptopyruvate sulfurtransferase